MMKKVQKAWTIVAKPKSNVERIDRDKAATMKLPEKLKKKVQDILLSPDASNDTLKNKPKRNPTKKR